MIERYYQQRPLFLRPIGQFLVLGAALVLVLWFASGDEDRMSFIFLMTALYAAFAGLALLAIPRLVFQRFRYSSYFGESVAHTLGDDALHVLRQKGGHSTSWTKFRSAVQFPDGMLLLRQGFLCWLPNTARQTGTADDVAGFLSTKMLVRSIA